MIIPMLHCPHCQSTDIVRHGITRQGKQRYRCRPCRQGRGRTFLLDYAYAGHSAEVKQQIVEMAMDVLPGMNAGEDVHHVLGQIGGQAVIVCRHIAVLHLGNEPIRIAAEAPSHESPDAGSRQRLAQHGEGMPLPLLLQQFIRQIIQMHPALRLGVPPPARRDEMQVRVELAIAPVCVQDDDVAAFEGLTAEVAKELIHTADPTPHELAQ